MQNKVVSFLLIIFCISFFMHGMDITDSQELKEIIVEQPDKKALLFEQLQDNIIDYNKHELKKVFKKVKKLNSNEKNNISENLRYWLLEQTVHPLNKITKTKKFFKKTIFWTSALIVTTLLSTACMVMKPATGLALYGLSLFFLIPLIFYACKTDIFFNKTLAIAINNKEVYNAQKGIFQFIKKRDKE